MGGVQVYHLLNCGIFLVKALIMKCCMLSDVGRELGVTAIHLQI